MKVETHFVRCALLLCEGNDNLHLLTSDKRQRLRVDLADFEEHTAYAEYDNFRVGSAIDKYRLVSLGTFNKNGTAGRQWNYFIVSCCAVLKNRSLYTTFCHN